MFAISNISSSVSNRNVLVVNYPYKWDEITIQNPEDIDAEMVQRGALFELIDGKAFVIPTQKIISLITNIIP